MDEHPPTACTHKNTKERDSRAQNEEILHRAVQLRKLEKTFSLCHTQFIPYEKLCTKADAASEHGNLKLMDEQHKSGIIGYMLGWRRLLCFIVVG